VNGTRVVRKFSGQRMVQLVYWLFVVQYKWRFVSVLGAGSFIASLISRSLITNIYFLLAQCCYFHFLINTLNILV